MKRSGKLSLALHALGHMAAADGKLRSEDLAVQNATNPVVVRRVLGLLREGGIVTSEKGHAGGWDLARPPEQITLEQVRVALGEPGFVRLAPPASDGCAIERRIGAVFETALSEAEALLSRHLADVTVADLNASMTGSQKE